MPTLLNCVFCNKPNVNLILFTEETLKKCRVILQHRKKHNLKFEDVVLPGELLESGYHRQCYKSFTGLNRKYYLPKNTATEKSTSKEKSLNIAENSPTESSTTVELDTQSIEPEASTSQDYNTTTTLIPGPSILPELVEPVSSKQGHIDHSENIYSPSEKSLNIAENSPTESSTTVELDTQSIEPEASTSQDYNTTTTLIPDPIEIPGPFILPELVEPVSSKQGHIDHSENIYSPSENNIAVDIDVNNASKNLTCIYCDQKTKKHKSKRFPLISSDKDAFLSKAKKQNENYTEFIDKIANYSHPKIYCHNICQLNFSYKASLNRKATKTHWHGLRQQHQAAFGEICSFIEENIIQKGRCYFLTYIFRCYMGLLEESDQNNDEEIRGEFKSHILESKIQKQFGKEIKFFVIQNKKLLVPKNLVVIDEKSFESLKDEDILLKAALLLRKSVLQGEKNKLPHKLTTKKLKEGEISVPKDLLNFYFTLIAGNNRRRKNNRKCIRQVKSYCEDVVYGIYNGKVKTSKHIMLGMALKSLTSSRKIIDIIHRYGHCISYPGVEELETEATYTSVEKSSVCPETIKKSPDLCTGVAFDNFDRFVETKTGKDTLHDTVGIIYQNVDVNTPEESQLINISDAHSEVTLNLKKRRRRTFEAISMEISEEPFVKKMKVTNLEGLVYEGENTQPESLQLYKTIDTLWMFSHALQLPNVPMWVGFNSLLADNNSPKQIVSYLTPINESPTNKSVVLETMKQSQKICKEVKQSSMQLTYDLAIAKIALQIQASHKPDFDNLFIHLGPFHIMMAYFKAVGKVIMDCGLTNVMVQSSLLTSGSVNGFLEGKHFNRCKRLHPLMAVGLEILHFKSFLEINNTATDQIIQELTRLKTSSISLLTIENEELNDLLNNYNSYKQQTLNGDFGKTPQFYLIYINLVHYYLSLSRSIRNGDFELFKFVLPKITNLFFICNQQNYARWTVKYSDNLLKVADTHPDLYEQFENGFFSIQRTSKPFSKQPIDLVLEQTINADAARRLTGIIQFTNSISARQRWALSHDIRSTIISYVYKDLDLQQEQDVTAELSNHNMKNNTKQLQKFIDTFDQFINPFSVEVPQDLLLNISSGKAASETEKKFLLNVEKNGDMRCQTFIAECKNDENRFEKSIKKLPLENFSLDYAKKTKTKVGGKVQEVRIQRDLFGRMLGISIDHKFDVAKILSYPITSVPLSMCHFDGGICKTQKSVLMKSLEKDVQHNPPSHIDILIIDGFFLLHTMKNVPKTFGNISKKILQMVTQLKATRYDVIFDQYFSPSIKDYERSRHESSRLEFNITGPDQVRPTDFAKELKNTHFKQALVDFFILHWATDEMVPFISNNRVCINFRRCHSFTVVNNKVMSEIDENLSCPEHEEADTKIIYHVCNIDVQANFVIRCSDTDIAAIMLGNMHYLKNDDSHVWILTGTGNKQRYVDITSIYEHLGPSMCRSLPGFHAITGCDYNPAFFKKGKQRPFSILKKNEEYQQAFLSFGTLDLFGDVDEEKRVFNTIQKFICDVYQVPGIFDVDAARLQLFISAYMLTDVNEKFKRKNMKNFDASNLPPCKSELWQQFRRANYIASLWNNASKKIINILSPENNGWTLEDDKYDFHWFDGDQLPDFVSQSLEEELVDEVEDGADDQDDLDIQYQDWLDDELSNFNEDDNED